MDLLAVVVALGALVVYELHGHAGNLTRDLGIYTYAGQQVLEGQAPYQAILNRAGPLAHLLPAIGIGGSRLLGVDDVLGVRVFYMLVAVGAVVAVYGLCRSLFGSRVVALAGAAAMLSFHGFIEYAADGPREKTPMVLALVLFCWALHGRRWFWAGVWLSLATLLLQIAFPLGAGAFLTAWLLVGRGRRMRALGGFVAGGLTPVAVLAAALAAVGALGDAVDAFLLINARYTVPNPPLENAGIVGRNVASAYGWSLGVLLLGVLALLALLALAPARARRSALSPTAATLTAYGGGLLVFLLWSLREFDSWADAFPALPLAAIGVAAVVAAVGDRVGPRPLAALVAVWAVVATGLSAAWSVDHRSDDLDAQRRLTAAILDPLPEGATFYSLEVPQPLVLGQRTSVSRLQTVAAGLDTYIDDTYPGGLPGLGRSIAAQRTTVLFIHTDEPVPTWLEPVLARDYEEVTGVESLWRTYLHRSLDPEVRREIERAARAADPA